jgi:hypothetical protein
MSTVRRVVTEETQVEPTPVEPEVQNINIAGDPNAAVSINVGEPGTVTGTSSTQNVNVNQSGGETVETTQTRRVTTTRTDL